MHKMAITYWLSNPEDSSDQTAVTYLMPVTNFDEAHNREGSPMLVLPAGQAWDDVQARNPGYNISEIGRSLAHPTVHLPNANIAINQAINILHTIDFDEVDQDTIQKVFGAIDALFLGLVIPEGEN